MMSKLQQPSNLANGNGHTNSNHLNNHLSNNNNNNNNNTNKAKALNTATTAGHLSNKR